MRQAGRSQHIPLPQSNSSGPFPLPGRVLPHVNANTQRARVLLMSLRAVGESTPSLTGYIFCIPFP
jgi:hypothetical protein